MDEERETLVQAKFFVEYADYKAYYWWIVLNFPQNRAALLVCAAGPLAVAAWLALRLAFARHVLDFEAFFCIWLAAVFIVLLLMTLCRPRIVYKRNKALLARETAFGFYEDYIATANLGGVLNEGKTGYSAFSQAYEGPQGFYLKTRENRYVILPKRCLAPEQVLALRELFASAYGANFIKRTHERKNA